MKQLGVLALLGAVPVMTMGISSGNIWIIAGGAFLLAMGKRLVLGPRRYHG